MPCPISPLPLTQYCLRVPASAGQPIVALIAIDNGLGPIVPLAIDFGVVLPVGGQHVYFA